MASLRFRGRGQRRRKTLLLVALGALTGMAVAVVLSDRGGRKGRRRDRLREADQAPDIKALDDEARVEVLEGDASDEPVKERAERFVDDDFADEFVEDDEFGDDEFGDEPPGPIVQPLAPGDEELEDRVLEAFHNDPTLRGRAIDIGAIGDGIIELTGWVHSAAEVGYAITLARGVPDVAHVMDSLTIRNPDHARARKPSADE